MMLGSFWFKNVMGFPTKEIIKSMLFLFYLPKKKNKKPMQKHESRRKLETNSWWIEMQYTLLVLYDTN